MESTDTGMDRTGASPLSPTLNDEERMLMATKELEASHQAWDAAEVLISQQLHREALTRGYFALFHAARALLLREGYNVRWPRDVLEVLGLRLIDAGEMPPEAPAVLARGERYRELCDYAVGWVVTPERVLAEMEVYEEHWSGLLNMLSARGVRRSSET
jgi:uncharacterized protein (UPF0332 family)